MTNIHCFGSICKALWWLSDIPGQDSHSQAMRYRPDIVRGFIGTICQHQTLERTSMANKQKVEAREKARQKRKTEKTIMYIAVGIGVLVVLGRC